jgi:hypothetical protein
MAAGASDHAATKLLRGQVKQRSGAATKTRIPNSEFRIPNNHQRKIFAKEQGPRNLW